MNNTQNIESTQADVRDERGMSTAEYAVGTVGACTIGGVLVKIGQSEWFGEMVRGVLDNITKFLPF